MTSDDETHEALERLVLEIDAITSIICDSHDINSTDRGDIEKDFIVTTPESLNLARAYLEQAANDATLKFSVPSIGVETFVCSSDQSTAEGVRLRICLPPGYPNNAAAEVTVLSAPKHFPKSFLDEISTRLLNRTQDLLGFETMMEVINECRDVLDDWQSKSTSNSNIFVESYIPKSPSCTGSLSRRWVWVHHITNSGRIKHIVQEARQLHLGGYVKGGYPGVVVIEGPSNACDEFIMWIKGNKSRPGGFGRNWGHHVRGEATIEARQLPGGFEELEDDMGKLGGLCREFGVEEEFRVFILQHKIIAGRIMLKA